MKYGLGCTLPAVFDDCARGGLDYMEFAMNEICTKNEAEYKSIVKAARDAGLAIETCNGYFPKDLKFVGADVDKEKVHDYIKLSVERAKYMGAKILVFGSGSSRAVPEGYSVEAAYQQIEETMCMINEYTAPEVIELVIEPLNSNETNVINKVNEAYELCKKMNLPSIHILGDLFHMGKEGDLSIAIDSFRDCADELRHVHISNPINRTIPYIGDGADYTQFFSLLKEIGYDNRITIEAICSPRYSELPDALREFFKVVNKYDS